MQFAHSLRSTCLLVAGALLVFGPTAAFGHGAIDEMILAYNAEIEKTPGNAELYFKLSQSYCEHNDWDLALAVLTKADELAPGKYPVDLARGRVLLAAKNAPEAKQSLDRSLAAYPGHPEALTLRARANELLGLNEECLADYRAALAVTRNPEPDIYLECATALALHGHEEEAVQVCGAGIEKIGAVPGLVMKALELEIKAKHFDAALTRVDAMQKLSPRAEPWMAKRAALLEQAGRAEESRAAWQALAVHLASLPNLQRGSHAMSMLEEQAVESLKRFSSKAP